MYVSTDMLNLYSADSFNVSYISFCLFSFLYIYKYIVVSFLVYHILIFINLEESFASLKSSVPSLGIVS